MKKKKAPPLKRNRGRPPLFNPLVHPKLVYSYARLGHTDKELSEILGISERTLVNWKSDEPEFMREYLRGKEGVDDLVENALVKRALGYTQQCEKPLTVALGAGLGSEVQMIEYQENVIPDVQAIKFYLTNRRPKRWRERQDINHSGEIDIPITLTREERAIRKAEIEKRIAEEKDGE